MCGLRMCATLMAPYYIAVSGWLTCATGPVEGSGRGPGAATTSSLLQSALAAAQAPCALGLSAGPLPMAPGLRQQHLTGSLSQLVQHCRLLLHWSSFLQTDQESNCHL